MKTVFEHKPDFTFREFAIGKAVTIPARKLEEMLRHPLRNHEVIVENAGVMGVDGDGVYRCLLVMGEGRTDGLLVESEGSGYARYASYVPEATALRYPTLSKLNRELAEAVDFIIEKGTGLTTEGNWTLTFEELEGWTGLCVEGKPFLQETLGDMLCSRPEVADVSLEDGQFDVAYYLDFCPNCRKETAQEELPDNVGMEEMRGYGYAWEGMLPLGREKALKLADEGLEIFILMPDGTEHAAESMGEIAKHNGLFGVERQAWQGYQEGMKRNQEQEPSAPAHRRLHEMLDARWENLHLVHDEVDSIPHTIVELDAGTLTEAGREAWADVLDAKVLRVFQGIYGLQMELSGVEASRLNDFSAMLGGCCSVEDYDRWVSQTEAGMAGPAMARG